VPVLSKCWNLWAAVHMVSFCLLTLWSRVLPEKLTSSQLVKQFTAFHGTRRFLTAFASALPVTTAWRVLCLRMEEWPQIWRVAAKILNKLSRTADKGWSSSFGFGRGAKSSSPWKRTMLKTIHKGFVLFSSVNISEIRVTGFKLRYLESRYFGIATELRPAK